MELKTCTTESHSSVLVLRACCEFRGSCVQSLIFKWVHTPEFTELVFHSTPPETSLRRKRPTKEMEFVEFFVIA